MIATPRTDEAEAAWERDGGGDVQRLFSLARRLEKELFLMTEYAENVTAAVKAYTAKSAPSRVEQ